MIHGRFTLPFIRTVALLVVGLGLLIYEAVFRSEEARETLIIAYLAMMGLGPFLQSKDESNQSTGVIPADKPVPPQPVGKPPSGPSPLEEGS